jgi:hypothetical protein
MAFYLIYIYLSTFSSGCSFPPKSKLFARTCFRDYKLMFGDLLLLTHFLEDNKH